MNENPNNKLPHYRQSKARHPHACQECRGRIEQGETYHSWSEQDPRWTRRWSVTKRCADCDGLAKFIEVDCGEGAVALKHLPDAVIKSGCREVLVRWVAILQKRGLPAELIQPYRELLQEGVQ